MTAFDSHDRRRLAWCLVVNGLPYRYFSGVAPGSSLTAGSLYDHDGGAAVQVPTDVLAVLDVGPIDAQLDDVAGIAAQEPVEVAIVARGARTAAGVRVDPYLTFMRTAGPSAAARSVKLLTSLEHKPVADLPEDVEVDKDVSAWTVPGPIFIGQEVLWADDTDGDGTPGNRYRFTDCTRGADLHATQDHPVADREREQPWVTSDVVNWRGRKAAIYVGAIVGTGVEAWEQYWSGFIDSAPELRDDRITVRIAPLTAVTRYKLGVGSAARSTVAAPGAHRIRTGVDGVGDRINALIKWDITNVRLEASATNAGAGTVTMTAASAAVFDSIGLPTDVTVETDGGIVVGAAADTIASYASPTLTMAGTSGGAFLAALAAMIAAGRPAIFNLRGDFVERYPLDLVDPADPGIVGSDLVVAWPDRLVDTIDTATAFQTVIDSWADPDSLGGASRYGRIYLRQNVGWTLRADIRPATLAGIEPLGTGRLSIHRGGQRICWAGWAVGQGVGNSVDGVGEVRGSTMAGGDRPARRTVTLDGTIVQRAGNGGEHMQWGIPGPAVWYYQSGEPFIGPFLDDIYTGGGEPQQIRISGEGTDALVWIVGTYTEAHPDGETGSVVWYEVDPRRVDRTPSIMQMDGEPALSAQVVASAIDVSPGEYILRLLASGIGNADNGTHDVMPIGCNVPSDYLLASSFLGMPAPLALRGQDYEAVRGKSIEEQCRGLLMASGAQAVARYNTDVSRWQITLSHMGPADSRDSILTLAQSDMELRPGRAPISTATDGRVVKSYRLRWNYNRDGQPVETPVSASTERNDAGADHGEPLELDLPGVVVDGGDGSLAQAAAELVADMRARVGTPRIRWRFAIRADFPGSSAVGIGDTITLTSEDAIAIRPTDTVSALPCRVVGLRRDLMENRLELEVRPYPALSAGWAPALLVTAVTDADTVVVSAATYSDNDVGFFAVGDAVSAVNAGDWSGRVQTTILTIAGTSITTAAAHGLAIGDTIRLDDYDDATASRTALGGFAYLADGDGLLGTANAPGQVIA